MKKIVLILPTYNEKENIVTLISAIEGVFTKLSSYKLQILVIDDFSPDNTAYAVTELTKKFTNLILLQKKKEGLGAAYVLGMSYALDKLKPDILVQMDADWSHNPLLLPEFIKKIEAGADFVIGSRYIQGGSIPGNWGLHRKIFSIIGNSIVRFGLGKLHPHDWTSGFRMLKAEIFTKVKTGLNKYSGYTFQIAFLHRAIKAGYKINEVPLQFIDRIHGKSKIAPVDYIKNVLIYVLNHSTFLKYLVIGTIGFTLQALISKGLVMLKIFPGLAVTIGALLAIIANYLGNNLWTFSHKKISGWSKLLTKFIYFLFTSFGAVVIQGVVVTVGVLIIGEAAWFWLMVFAIVFLVIPYNYFIYNRFIWKKN